MNGKHKSKVSEEETKENKVSEAIVRGFALNSYDNFNAYNEQVSRLTR